MISEIFFSIIIPTYNRANLIEKTINSFLNQNYSNYELIVIDDGSTDNTHKVVNKFITKKVKYFYKNNEERGAARNYGLTKSIGEYVNFFDSDDLAYPNHLSIANKIINETNLEIIHLGYDIKKEHSSSRNNPVGKLSKKMMYGNIMLPNSTFLSKKLATSFKFSETRLLSGTEDYLFWLKILGKQEIYGFSDTTSSLIMHESRSMSEYNGDKNKNRQDIFLDELKKNKNFLLKFNKYFNVIKSSSLLLISLDYSMEKKVKKALKYLIKSLVLCPAFIYSKRPYAIIKNIIFK